MIPKHEDLGDLVTTETEWYRPIYAYWEEEDKELFEEENGVAFCVVDRSSGMFDSGRAIWGFAKLKPFSLIAEENDGIKHIETDWTNDELRNFIGIRFNNGDLWDSRNLKEVCHVEGLVIHSYADGEEIKNCPVYIDETDRCISLDTEDKTRCIGFIKENNLCNVCMKRQDKIKAGKLRECKYCSSTYHSTRSCELNPKVIAEKERIDAIVRRVNA